MDKQETIGQLKNIVKPYVQDHEAFGNLNENTDFINDLKINSANLVDIILDIEDYFEISIDNQAMAKMINVESALEIIQTQLSEK